MGTWLALAAAVTDAGAQTPADVHVRYLGTSGWRIVTPGHVLLFDWVEGNAGLADPALLEGRRLIAFVSHHHADHASDSLMARAAAVPGARVVQGWDGPDLPGRVVLGPRRSARVGDASVTTIASTDAGVGFLVEVDGVRIFHAGDHAQWTDGLAAEYRAELGWLAERSGPVDLAVVPIATGMRCEPRETLYAGAVFAVRTLNARAAAPMHVRCRDRLELYAEFAARVSRELPDVRTVVAGSVGQEWTLQR